MSVLTDRELLEHAQGGDAAAWRALYERLLPVAWASAVARTGDRQAAEDIVSESFLALVRHLPNLDPETCHLFGWLNRVIRSKSVDWVRRRQGQQQAINGFSREPEHRLPSDPSGRAMRIEERAAVLDVLDAIRDEYREVLEMKYKQGQTVKQIADRLGQTEKGAESLLHRARTEFRTKYEFHNKQEDMPAVPALRSVAACREGSSDRTV